MNAAHTGASPRRSSIPLDPNALLALDALLTERSVTRAAARLGVTQSAASHKLRALRESLGDPLLVGGRGGMVLTARAQAMQEPLARALSDLVAVVERSQPFSPATSRRHFTVLASDFGEFVAVPRVLAVLGQKSPGITITLAGPSRDIPRDLATAALDLAAGPRFPQLSGLMQKKVADDPFVVVARKGHPRLGKKLSLARYLELDHVLVAPGGTPGGIVDDLLAARGLSRRVVVRTSYFVTAPFLVARSDLLLTVPLPIAREAARHADLVLFEPPLPIPSTESFLYWHERSNADPAHLWLRTLTERAIRGVQIG